MSNVLVRTPSCACTSTTGCAAAPNKLTGTLMLVLECRKANTFHVYPPSGEKRTR